MTTVHHFRVLVATVVAACAFVLFDAPVSAYGRPPNPLAPGCNTGWGMPTGLFVLNQDNGIVVEMEGWGGASGRNLPQISYHLSPALFGSKDVIRGKVANGNVAEISGAHIDFTAIWDKQPGSAQFNTYTGNIDDRGFAEGSTTNDGGVTNGWKAVKPLECVIPAKPVSYSAIAYSFQNWAIAKDFPERGYTEQTAMSKCPTGCAVVSVPDDAGQPCVAVAVGPFSSTNTAYGPTEQSAADAARQNYNGVGAAVVKSVCSTNPDRVSAHGVLDSGEFPQAQPAGSEITLYFDDPTLLGITAHVGITNNAGKPAVTCELNNGIIPIPTRFSVTGDKVEPVLLPAPTAGVTYSVSITCPGAAPYQKNWTW